MILSRKHEYLFLQLPHTGSTAVAEELERYYDGQYILDKHSTYSRFLEWAPFDPSNLFVFSAVRNPLDEILSMYYKLKRDHKGNYSDPANYVQNGGWVGRRAQRRFRYIQKRDASFSDFLRRFYWLPYANWSVSECQYIDFVMAFERLGEGFENALERIGVEQVRSLPVKNKTDRPKKDLSDAYPSELRRWAAWVFGPYMDFWDYDFPEQWDISYPERFAKALFLVSVEVKSVYWKHSKSLRRWIP